jgi:hypothetical protein
MANRGQWIPLIGIPLRVVRIEDICYVLDRLLWQALLFRELVEGEGLSDSSDLGQLSTRHRRTAILLVVSYHGTGASHDNRTRQPWGNQET